MTESTKNYCCSFCAKERTNVTKLIAGPGVNICDECVTLCASILVKEKQDPGSGFSGIPDAYQIKEFLDQFIIGQEDAKMVLSVAVNNHYKRLLHPIIDGVELDKSNLLMLGPSGSGKCCSYDTLVKLKISEKLYSILN